MNSINKILIIGIVYLLSNTIHAQIYQYSEDGKDACIDCLPKSASERDCYCNIVFDFAKFEDNIPTDHTKDEWLQRQEGILKEAIENDFFFGQQFDTYEHAQEAFFELYQGNVQAAIYYPDIKESFETEVNHNPIAYSSSKEKATILERRRTEIELVNSGQPRQVRFGDLTYNNVRIEDITGVDYINQHIGQELNTFNTEHDRLVNIDRLRQRFDQAKLDGFIENFLARQFTYHYATLESAEERIRLMTAYIVAYKTKNESLITVNNGFSPLGIDLRDQDFTERLTRLIRDYDITLDPVNAYNPNIDNAIFNHALKTEFSETSRNFLRKVPNQPYREVLKGYLQSNEYSAGAMSLSNDLTTSNVNGVAIENNNLLFSHNQAYPPGHPIFLLETGQTGFSPNGFARWNHTNLAINNGMDGFFDLTESLRGLEGGSLNPTTEGSLIESALRVAGRYQINWSSYTHADLGHMFNLKPFTFTHEHLPMVEIEADHNIGQILLNNDFPAYQFFQNDLALEAARAIANGDLPTAEHYFRVADLNKSLFLNAEQISWISSNNTQTELLHTFIENNTMSPELRALGQALVNMGAESGVAGIPLYNDFVTGLINNQFMDFTPFVNPNTTIIAEGYNVNCCPDDYYDPFNPDRQTELIFALGRDLAVDFGDAFYSTLLRSFEWWVTDEYEGSFVRDMLEFKGIEIPFDIDDESLGELFKVRYDNQEITILYDSGLGADLLELGTDVISLLAVISPSKGGGAFLAINGGEKVTIASLRQYLKLLKESYFRPIGSMIGKRIGHTFSKHGLHNTEQLKSFARNGDVSIGQWLNEIEAEKFIARHLNQLSNGVRDIPIPAYLQNIGRVFRNGDAAILNPTHIRLVPSGSGVKTAYPINSTLTPLETLGTYVP